MNYPLYPADPSRDPAEPFRRLDPAPTTGATAVIEPAPGRWEEVVDSPPPTAEELVDRQREAFGGAKVGSAFFGWIVAAATGAVLTGAVVVVDALLGLGVVPDPWASAGIGPVDAIAVGWTVVGVLLAIVLVSFYCGGYVAGRMARFSGVAQGFVVWLWAVVTAVIVGVVGAVLDGRYGFVAVAMDALPDLPASEDLRPGALVVGAVAIVLASLGGALLGGHVGIRYHRRVDRAGLAG